MHGSYIAHNYLPFFRNQCNDINYLNKISSTWMVKLHCIPASNSCWKEMRDLRCRTPRRISSHLRPCLRWWWFYRRSAGAECPSGCSPPSSSAPGTAHRWICSRPCPCHKSWTQLRKQIRNFKTAKNAILRVLIPISPYELSNIITMIKLEASRTFFNKSTIRHCNVLRLIKQSASSLKS